MTRGIRRREDGTYEVGLSPSEQDLLEALPAQLRDALAAGEPTLYRLFPPAHPDDQDANAEYAELVGPGLLEGKLLALAELARTARHVTLTEDELGAWLGGLESLRLTLGTQLEITEESYDAFDEDDPDAARLALFHWLSWLQEEVVQALASTLPQASDGWEGVPGT